MFQPSSPRGRLSHSRRSVVALGAAAALAVAALPGVPAWARSNHAQLDLSVVTATADGQRVGVILVARGDLDILESDLLRTGIRHAARVPIAHGMATELTPSLVEHFSHDPNVARIIYDAPVRLSDAPFDPAGLATVYASVVDAAVDRTHDHRLTGRAIGVAVIDSGIAPHADLDARVIASVNFNPTVTGTGDAFGHGTAVASIIAGDGGRGKGRYVGIAPEANLINLRVNDGTGAAPTSAILNAILWAVANQDRYNIRVMNLSLLASVAESYRTSPIDAAVEYAWLHGIVVVVAAGNLGPQSALYAPANDPYVITVGATDDHGTVAVSDDTLGRFSSYGVTQDGYPKPDLVAPGLHIVAALAPGSNFALNHPDHLVGSRYIQLSGTSVASPIVAGVAALYLQRNDDVRPGQVKALLRATAQRLPFAGSGYGYPDTARALAQGQPERSADRGLQPNNYLKLMYLQAKKLGSLTQVSWDSVSWDSVSWDSVSWDSVSWDSVSWDSVSWDSVSWDE
jgi:serine protease AprX